MGALAMLLLIGVLAWWIRGKVRQIRSLGPSEHSMGLGFDYEFDEDEELKFWEQLAHWRRFDE